MVSSPAAGPRRAPAPTDRQRDAERSRWRLLDAALEEFSAKGFAGARVGNIAERAGVNKQLINYYFDGKEGLYRAVQRAWLEREAATTGSDAPLGDVVTSYLHHALADPRPMRLVIWRGLSEPGDEPPDTTPERENLSSLLRRQAAGELAGDLDVAAVRLLLIAAVAAPVAMPQLVRKLFGLDPSTPEFEERYGDALRRIVLRLAGDSTVASRPTGHGCPS